MQMNRSDVINIAPL